MRIKYIIKGIIATLLLTLAITSCESYNEPLLDGIGNTREFSPLGLKAIVRSQTNVELTWTTSENADHYVVEFSADDPNFTTIYKTVETTADKLPIQVQLEGETVYSIRVKSVSSGLEDSKWSVTTATTLSEQLFLAIVDGDIQAKEATLRWVANSNVTQITINPGNITHTITADEKASGIATITGLTGETTYTAVLFNGTKKRGSKDFTTGIDIGTGILVKTTDDLFQAITDAEPGAVLVLEPGDYTTQTGLITLSKPITIRGLRSYNKPKLHVNFLIKNGSTNLSLIDLDLNGDKTLTEVVKYGDESGDYGTLLISGCNIHDFAKSLISTGSLKLAKLTSVTVENTIVTNVLTSSGDFIDIRGSYIGQLTLKNSTFNNCSTARDFIRMDNGAGTLSGTGLTTNILIDGCTIYNPNMVSATSRIFYVRFAINAIIVRNTLFANSDATFSKDATTSLPTFSNNYYFNSPKLITGATTVRPDTAGIVADPQFKDVAAGNLTIQNQTLIDNKVGDPRVIN